MLASQRLLYAEPLRPRMRVMFDGGTLVDTEDVLIVHEPGRYPVAWFPIDAVSPGSLRDTERVTEHPDLGALRWMHVSLGGRQGRRAARRLDAPPVHAALLADRVAFVWPAMDGFYEEDERILGHPADVYHRIDIRNTHRHLQVRHAEREVADTGAALVLYETGFAPRWYVPVANVDQSLLPPVEHRTYCPYKDEASYYDVTVPGGGRGPGRMELPESAA